MLLKPASKERYTWTESEKLGKDKLGEAKWARVAMLIADKIHSKINPVKRKTNIRCCFVEIFSKCIAIINTSNPRSLRIIKWVLSDRQGRVGSFAPNSYQRTDHPREIQQRYSSLELCCRAREDNSRTQRAWSICSYHLLEQFPNKSRNLKCWNHMTTVEYNQEWTKRTVKKRTNTRSLNNLLLKDQCDTEGNNRKQRCLEANESEITTY